MQSEQPNVTGVDFARQVLAENQPEYETLPVAVILGAKGSGRVDSRLPMVARFTLSDEERQIIADGGELYVHQLTFGRAYHPTGLVVVPKDAEVDYSQV